MLDIVYNYSTVQARLSPEVTREILKFSRSLIAEEDLSEEPGYGVEDEPHITIFYGIKEATPNEELEEAMERIGPFKSVKFAGLGMFDAPEHDVLIVEVDAPQLVELHNAIEKIYPDNGKNMPYHSHLTVAYVKKGMAQKYIDKYSDRFVGEFPIGHIEFSSMDREVHKLSSVKKVSYVAHVPGHKNSQGEAAPWVVKSHETGKILSSHKTKTEANKHLRQMRYFKHKGSIVVSKLLKKRLIDNPSQNLL